MKIRKVDAAGLKDWVDALTRDFTTYGPQAKDGQFAFGELYDAEDLRLDYDVSILPPKKYLQPQRELLLTFTTDGVFESVMNDREFVLLGVHPYDMVAINQMDQTFAKDHRDEHYFAYRERATIVVSDVQAASENVFAGFMGTATGADCDGHDVLLTLLPDGCTMMEAKTVKGEVLMERLTEVEVGVAVGGGGGSSAPSPTVSDADLDARASVWAANREALRKHELKMDPSELPGLLERNYNHPVWEEKSKLCHSCGSCNLVCPTCYCFDVADELNWDMRSGTRTRCWDSCMTKPFAKVAGNHDFRPMAAARYRHRYFRKGKYTFDAIGEITCVGCGRCISSCTTQIANPVEIFNRLLEEA